MNQTTKTFLFIFFLPFLAFGQITINQSDVQSTINPGTGYSVGVDTNTINVDLGNLGQSSWDFSSVVVTDYNQDVHGVDPNTTPFITDFPSATACQEVTFSYPVTTTVYNYGEVSSDAFYYLGSITEMVVGTITTRITASHSPKDRILKLPVTHGTTWTNDLVTTVQTKINNIVIGTTMRNEHSEYTCDAYGTMTLPGGYTEECLRIKHDTRTFTTPSGGTGYYDRTIDYTFIGKSGASVTVSVVDTNAAETGVVACLGASVTLSLASDIEDDFISENMDFHLEQNYPNPFNPSTAIRFSLPEASEVSLKVYDVLGNEVAELHNGYTNAGNHIIHFQADNLASGLYIARLTAGQQTETMKMTLMK